MTAGLGHAPGFGLTLPQRGVYFGAVTYPDLLEMAATADACPLIEAVWVGDSLTAKPRPDSLTLLGALAAVTNRVRLGVGCMASFPVRDVITFAYQWATLDRISQGRMALAVCTGLVGFERASAREGAHWGVADRERVGRMEEHIAVCRRLWDEDGVTFQGAYRSFADLSLEPKPVQRPCPIWIAANPAPGRYMERASRRIARLADGWQGANVFPDLYAVTWQAVSAALAEAERDPEAFPTAAYHNINIGADRQACLEEAQRFLDHYYGPSFTPPMTEAWTAAGDAGECAAQIMALRAAGARHITLRLTSWDQRGQYRRLVEDVLPRLA